MTQSKYTNLYDGLRLYVYDTNKLTADDFLRLEQVAALENEIMKHRIFLVFKLDKGMKVFTSLN